MRDDPIPLLLIILYGSISGSLFFFYISDPDFSSIHFSIPLYWLSLEHQSTISRSTFQQLDCNMVNEQHGTEHVKRKGQEEFQYVTHPGIHPVLGI